MTGPVEALNSYDVLNDPLGNDPLKSQAAETDDERFAKLSPEAQSVWLCLYLQGKFKVDMQKNLETMKAEQAKAAKINRLTDTILDTKASNGSWTRPSTEPVAQLIQEVNALNGDRPLMDPNKEQFTREETQELIRRLQSLSDKYMKKGEEFHLKFTDLHKQYLLTVEFTKNIIDKIHETEKNIIRRISGNG